VTERDRSVAEDLRRRADVLVVLDDWKSSRTDECSFTARSFRLSEPTALASLLTNLRKARAGEWHASGKRDQFECLFTSPSFKAILRAVLACDSRLFSMLVSLPEIRLVAQGRSDALLGMSERIRQRWDPPGEAGIHAAALHLALSRLLVHLASQYPSDRRFELVTDRFSWFKPTRTDQLLGLGRFGSATCSLDVSGIANKAAPSVAPFLLLLGLVDSEAWFFGRYFRGLPFADLTTIVDRLRAPRREGDGHIQNDRLFSEPEFAALLSPHIKGGHHRFLRYMKLWAEWYRQGLAFNLNQSIAEADEAKRMLVEELGSAKGTVRRRRRSGPSPRGVARRRRA
jgi:hypothetical protein